MPGGAKGGLVDGNFREFQTDPLPTAEPGNKPLVTKTLQRWKADADLAGVRNADGLAKLPEPERAEWRALWDDVDALLKSVGKS